MGVMIWFSKEGDGFVGDMATSILLWQTAYVPWNKIKPKHSSIVGFFFFFSLVVTH